MKQVDAGGAAEDWRRSSPHFSNFSVCSPQWEKPNAYAWNEGATRQELDLLEGRQASTFYVIPLKHRLLLPA